MKNVKLVLLLGFVASLGWVGCKKGDTGPAGPAGPVGPDSVLTSAWTPLAFNYVVTDSLFEDSLATPAITQAILDSGVILTYVNLGSSTETHIVPTSSVGNYGFAMAEEFEVGRIVLIANDDYSTLPYRYTIIPGSKLQGNSANRTYKGYTIQELKSMSFDKATTITAPAN